MRRVARTFLLAIGSIVAAAGFAVALLAGPDDIVSTGDRELTSETVGFVTSASLVRFIGPSLYVAATAANDREVFIGVGHQVDVTGYLDGIAYDQIAGLRPPTAFDLARIDGAVTNVDPEPGTRDWWYVQAAGTERQEVLFPLGAEPVNAVVMGADGQPPLEVTVELGLKIDNVFVTALLVLAVGVGLLAIAAFALRPRQRVPAAEQLAEPAPQEERQR